MNRMQLIYPVLFSVVLSFMPIHVALALSASCGNGCSSEATKAGQPGVHCTDWEPTIDISNTGGKCQAIKACIMGSCSTTIYSRSDLSLSASQPRVCVNAPGGKVTINVGERVIPIDIDSFLNPGGGDKALCCANCSSSISCTGCTNLPALSTCHGEILNCPEGEILDEDGEGNCA